MNERELLLASFDHVIQSAQPDHCMKHHIPQSPKGRMIVIGAGKASAKMAAVFEREYDGAVQGLVITRYGHAVPTQTIRIIEAAHPVPDEAGCAAVAEILDMLKTVQEEDIIVCLISGGGSSLLSRPVEGLSFDHLQKIQKQLLGSGASIHEMNIVRKHLNIALGGGLAKCAPHAQMITMAISDVVGDDPSIIASGASVADPSTLKDARAVFDKYGITAPEAMHDPMHETPKLGDPIFNNNAYHLIATPLQSLKAAQDFWQAQGFEAEIWNAEVEGDSEEAAKQHAAYILDLADKIDRPHIVLSGGETTMTLTSQSGRGGPNTHFMLQSAMLLDGHPRIYAMACDTDGIDGDGDHAGAIITPDTLARMHSAGLDAHTFLSGQNSYDFFDALGDLVRTGPTYTNVNDYRAFLVLP